MTDDELHRELDRLHDEISRVHRMIEARGGVGWLRFIIRDLEVNPHTQYRVHLWGAVYWLVNFPAVTLLFFFAPGLWLKLGIFITLIYSIYANFATDYGAMSAALAAYGGDPLPEIPTEP